MAIPNNITREHLIEAIKKIDAEGIPTDAKSKYYDVIYNEKTYPPKLIVSYANMYANGIILDRDSFGGGIGTPCFKILEENGFEIIKKKGTNPNQGYYNELMNFLDQSRTENLGTQEYSKEFQSLKVKVSFGKGNQAKIPWIAFLNEENTVQEGIYPVYLYYKEKNLLILAYGVSETNTPHINWQLSNPLTVKNFFHEKGLGEPDRYGSSFIFKSYDVTSSLDEDTIDKDLEMLLSIYKSYDFKKNSIQQTIDKFDSKKFYTSALEAGYYLNEKLSIRFCASLLTKPFVILTGLSGSGKTKLAQAFAQWISKDESQYRIIPVGADWTNREPLLGYPNALKEDEYVKPDNGALDLIIQANAQPDLPHFLILDEMNLSHVERYFADFLSVMESNEEISLYAEGSADKAVPAKIKIPANLFIIGTVNIDETTNMFSPKVLDRANTIEFRVTKDEMKIFLENVKAINLDELAGKGAGMAKSFLEMAGNRSFTTTDIDAINTVLVQFFSELKKTGAEFGYRTATEILRLIHQLSLLDSTLTTTQKVDIAIIQKLLPKLHGSRRKLCPILETLGSFCISDKLQMIKDVFENPDFDFQNEHVRFPLSLEKITRMYSGAIDNGFASFAEA